MWNIHPWKNFKAGDKVVVCNPMPGVHGMFFGMGINMDKSGYISNVEVLETHSLDHLDKRDFTLNMESPILVLRCINKDKTLRERLIDDEDVKRGDRYVLHACSLELKEVVDSCGI